MASKVFQTVLNRKIATFAATFVEDSSSIFFDDQNSLIHPGEYGKYRENALKDLLRCITKHKVSDGFIITPDDKISTQIDIVIYKNDESPILENNYTNFFSIESVIAIGEVKSTLDKTSFIEAVRKLALNKQLFQFRKGEIDKRKYNGIEHDEIISFLVCKSTSFNLQTIDFEEIYKGVESRHRHNFILDIEKGLIGYEFNFSNFSSADEKLFSNNGGNTAATIWYEYPVYTFNRNSYNCKSIIHFMDTTKKHYHLNLFLTQLTRAIESKSLYSTEFLYYLDIPVAPIFY